jgi:hypothetical protein
MTFPAMSAEETIEVAVDVDADDKWQVEMDKDGGWFDEGVFGPGSVANYRGGCDVRSMIAPSVRTQTTTCLRRE